MIGLIVAFTIAVLHLVVPGLILLCSLWIIGAAVTRYDAYAFEVIWGWIRMPRVLRAR